MATTYPGLNNEANWVDFIDQSKTSEKLSDGSYLPIPQFISGYTLTGKLIRVMCGSSTAPSYYKNAGWLTQTVFAGGSTGGGFRTRVDKSWFLLLDRTNLIIPNPAFPEYGIIIDVPYWYDQMSIIASEYKGPVDDSLINQLASMDMKLDQILTP
jgi:hypothetical protein